MSSQPGARVRTRSAAAEKKTSASSRPTTRPASRNSDPTVVRTRTASATKTIRTNNKINSSTTPNSNANGAQQDAAPAGSQSARVLSSPLRRPPLTRVPSAKRPSSPLVRQPSPLAVAPSSSRGKPAIIPTRRSNPRAFTANPSIASSVRSTDDAAPPQRLAPPQHVVGVRAGVPQQLPPTVPTESHMSTSTAAAAPVSAPVASRPLSDTPRSTPVRAAAAAPSQQQSSAVKPRPRPVLVAESSPRTQPQQQKFSRGYSSMRPPSPYKPIVCNTGGSGSLHRDPHRRPPVGGPTQPMRTLSHLPAALQRPPSSSAAAGVRPRMACLGRMDTAPPPAGGNSSTTKGPPAAAAYHPEPSSRSHLSDELVVPSGRPSADPSGYDSGRSPSAPQVHNTARKRKAQSISVSAYSAAEEDFLEAAAPLKLDFDDAGATVDSTKFCRSS